MILHDYFDGTAHCVECGGRCQLKEEQQDIGNAIRHLIEALAICGYGPNVMISGALVNLGLDPEHVWKRARSAVNR